MGLTIDILGFVSETQEELERIRKEDITTGFKQCLSEFGAHQLSSAVAALSLALYVYIVEQKKRTAIDRVLSMALILIDRNLCTGPIHLLISKGDD